MTPHPPSNQQGEERPQTGRCECGGEWVDRYDDKAEWTECADCETVKHPASPGEAEGERWTIHRCHRCGGINVCRCVGDGVLSDANWEAIEVVPARKLDHDSRRRWEMTTMATTDGGDG